MIINFDEMEYFYASTVWKQFALLNLLDWIRDGGYLKGLVSALLYFYGPYRALLKKFKPPPAVYFFLIKYLTEQ